MRSAALRGWGVRLLLALLVGGALSWPDGPRLAAGQEVGPQVVTTVPIPVQPPGTRVSIAGTFIVIWGDPDPPTKGRHRQIFAVVDDTGKSAVLELNNDVRRLGGPLALIRKKVRVSGTFTSAGRLKVDLIELDQPSSGESADEVSASLSGSQKFVTLPCKFRDFPNLEPRSRSYFVDLMSNTFPGMDHYWRQVSFGNINLSGSVVRPWRTLPNNRSAYFNSDGSANLGKLADECAGAHDNDVFFPDFKGINMMFNRPLDGASWGGTTFIFKDFLPLFPSATWLSPTGFADQRVVGHEMGHAHGLPHSSGPYDETYDSSWDVMSGGGNCTDAHSRFGCLGDHTISHHKDRLGWIPGSRKFKPDDGSHTTRTIERLAQPSSSSSTLMAEIPVPGSLTQFYTVEARRLAGSTSGYDDRGAIPREGVVIHKVDLLQFDQPARVVDQSDNDNPNDAGAVLTAGEAFTKSADKLQVRVLSATSSGFRVRLTRGAPPNNDFGAALNVTLPHSSSRNNVFATTETGEPRSLCSASNSQIGRTVWYRLPGSSSTRTVTVSTAGSELDTVVAVYRGSSLNGLTRVACNDNFGNTTQSQVTITAGANTLFIQVGGKGSANGHLEVRIREGTSAGAADAADIDPEAEVE